MIVMSAKSSSKSLPQWMDCFSTNSIMLTLWQSPWCHRLFPWQVGGSFDESQRGGIWALTGWKVNGGLNHIYMVMKQKHCLLHCWTTLLDVCTLWVDMLCVYLRSVCYHILTLCVCFFSAFYYFGSLRISLFLQKEVELVLNSDTSSLI